MDLGLWSLLITFVVIAVLGVYLGMDGIRRARNASAKFEEIKPLLASSNFAAGGYIPVDLPVEAFLKVERIVPKVDKGIVIKLYGDLYFKVTEGSQLTEFHPYTENYATNYRVYTDRRVSIAWKHEGLTEAEDFSIVGLEVKEKSLEAKDVKIVNSAYLMIKVNRVLCE